MLANSIVRNKLVSAIRVGILWWILGAIQVMYEYIVVYNYGIGQGNFKLIVSLKSTWILLIAGVLAGFLLFPKVKLWLRAHSYSRASALTVLGVSGLFIVISSLGSFVYNTTDLQAPFYSSIVLAEVGDYLTGTENLKNYVFWLFIGIITVVATEINDKYGPGNFVRFLSGKYFHPQKEDRIFMFLDIRSATTIAEQLEELQYFNFLKDFFQDITPAILRTGGDIYQYVGDEVIISWPLRDDSNNNTCVDAFFEIKKDLESKAKDYLQKYGLVPSFKVGLHCGKVVVGEIGIIKRDISFSGDVLNTASRIQAKCNEFGVDILISSSLADRLATNAANWNLRVMEKVALKGKKNPVLLYSVQDH